MTAFCRKLLLSALLLTVTAGCSVSATTYLDQEAPSLEPERFLSELLPAAWFAGTFSPDMTEFYFNSPSPNAARPMSGLQWIDDAWTDVDFAAPNAFEPHICPTGDKMFFVLEDGQGRGVGHVSIRENEQWGEPEPLPEAINGGSYFPMYITSTTDGTLYWTMLSFGALIVRTPFVDNTYARPEIVRIDLNSTGACAHPYIAPDESYLIFDCEDDVTSDLYITFRTQWGGWTASQRIDEISTPDADELAASVSPDGKVLFFARDLQVYWVDAAILDSYKP